MNWDKAKNWVFGGGGAVAFVILLAFLDWRISVIVGEKLSAQDIGTDSKIVNMDTNIESNKSGVAENKEDIGLTQRQLEQVANILMRPPD